MTLAEKISVTAAMLNALTFVVMAAALLLQAKAFRRARRDTELALLGVRSQSITTLIAYLDARLSRLDPKDGLEVQRERDHTAASLHAQVSQLNTILEYIATLEKED